MPTLFRLLLVIGTLAVVVYAAMYAMVTYLEPHPRPIDQAITLPKGAK